MRINGEGKVIYLSAGYPVEESEEEKRGSGLGGWASVLEGLGKPLSVLETRPLPQILSFEKRKTSNKMKKSETSVATASPMTSTSSSSYSPSLAGVEAKQSASTPAPSSVEAKDKKTKAIVLPSLLGSALTNTPSLKKDAMKEPKTSSSSFSSLPSSSSSSSKKKAVTSVKSQPQAVSSPISFSVEAKEKKTLTKMTTIALPSLPPMNTPLPSSVTKKDQEKDLKTSSSSSSSAPATNSWYTWSNPGSSGVASKMKGKKNST